MDLSALSESTRAGKIHDAAMQLGLSDIAFARYEPLEQESKRLATWLDQGMHGNMAYIERGFAKRYDAKEILADVRTVVVASLIYDTPARHSDSPDHGKVSRYAWGTDYHEVFTGKMRQLAAFITGLEPGAHARSYVDTGPVLEKAWAVRSGLGWQGKHTNVISRKYGSFFFLGVVLTNLRLEYGNAIPDYCGSCTACIDACPTKAIVEPYVVDARRCISYWTIETKPEVDFPDDIVGGLDGWLFGCDVCQDVCPWNRFRVQTTEPAFLPRQNQTELALEWVERLEQAEFSERFRQSPLKRPKMAGIKRNARMLRQARARGKRE